MAIEFTSANEASEVGGVKALVYGGSGVGKTVLMATLPTPILISAESGLLSLRRANLERLVREGKLPADGLDYDVKTIKVSTVEDLAQAHAWCKAHAYSNGFRSVGLDSISEIMEVVLANAKRQVKDPRQAYGELIEKGQMLVREFRDLPGLNVCVAAKMEPAKDELTGITKYGPSVPGSKLGPSLPYFFDEVFHLGINKTPAGEPYRYLRTQPDIQYEAKDRSGMLAEIEYPHLGAVFSKVLGAK
jgi:hypothetical protein